MDISDKNESKIKKLGLLLKLIWFGQFISYGLYVFIAYKGIQNSKIDVETNQNDHLLVIFGILAFLIIILSFIYRYFVLSPLAVSKVFQGRFPKVIAMGFKKNELEDKGKGLEDFTGSQGRLSWYLSIFMNLQLMHWGMLNTCGLFGLVAAILTKNLNAVFPFIGISVLILLFMFPRLKALILAGIRIIESNQYKEI